MEEGLVFDMSDSSRPGEARRAALALASRLGFPDEEAGKLAIIVTELATNLLRHGAGGELLVRPMGAQHAAGIQILALDKGPGITNVGEALRDGFSTAGSPGTGLGAARRLATTFDIHSMPGGGTGVLARVWSRRLVKPPRDEALEIGAICLPRPGETVCGDGWAVEQQDGRSTILVVDGLGHGLHAAEAAREAVHAFRAHVTAVPQRIVEAVHVALRSTRGAALAVAAVEPKRRVAQFCGLGNIAGCIVSPEGSRHLVSHNGTAGHTAPRASGEFRYPWPGRALLVLHSDGLGTHWDLQRYPGLGERHPGLIAGILYRDFKRGRDDVTVVVGREPRGESLP